MSWESGLECSKPEGSFVICKGWINFTVWCPLPKVSIRRHHAPSWACSFSSGLPSLDGGFYMCTFMICCAGGQGSHHSQIHFRLLKIHSSFICEQVWVQSWLQTVEKLMMKRQTFASGFQIDSNSSFSLKQLEGKLGWKQDDCFWFLILCLWIPLHRGGCTHIRRESTQITYLYPKVWKCTH